MSEEEEAEKKKVKLNMRSVKTKCVVIPVVSIRMSACSKVIRQLFMLVHEERNNTHTKTVILLAANDDHAKDALPVCVSAVTR